MAPGTAALFGPTLTHNLLGEPEACSDLPESSSLDVLRQLSKQTADDRRALR